MDASSSVVTAMALSAAAGKNPWIPLGLILLIAAPAEMPSWLMDPSLHAGLHGLAAPGWLYGLGGFFLLLATLEAVADKIPVVQSWLLPLSTLWRPFAAIAVATLVALAAESGGELAQASFGGSALPSVHAELSLGWLGLSVGALTVLAGAVAGYLATIAKTGVRLALGLLPLPGLRLAHSIGDDLFALAATLAGAAFGGTTIVALLVALYVFVGLFAGPILARLTWIHLRIGWGIARKALGEGLARPPPPWLLRALAAEGVGPDAFLELPCYAYRAPVLGRCRAGHLVFTEGGLLFIGRVFFRARVLRLERDRLARFGLAQTSTSRTISIIRTSGQEREELRLHLFPMSEEELLGPLERGTRGAGLQRVRLDSPSARAALPGYDQIGRSSRFVGAERAGSLRAQALLGLIASIGIGTLTLGVFIPIGAGYLLSPFKPRFAIGLLASTYLALCAVGSMGVGLPACILYASMLNLIALRDLVRQAIRARHDGMLDLHALLPPVCDRAWVPPQGLHSEADLFRQEASIAIAEGPWRLVARALAA
ncbi:MAG: hypothetical protein OEY14_13240 [Myxococcales bacterium]|nr:hypothetical protein [Myxococcales bacterium]